MLADVFQSFPPRKFRQSAADPPWSEADCRGTYLVRRVRGGFRVGNFYSAKKIFGNSHGGTIPPRTPPGSAWVRAGPRRTPAESAKFNFAAEQKIPPRNPPRTRRTAAEQICSAADPIGSAADWRNFRRRNALKRVRASPPQGYSESVRRGLLKNFVFAELFRD